MLSDIYVTLLSAAMMRQLLDTKPERGKLTVSPSCAVMPCLHY